MFSWVVFKKKGCSLIFRCGSSCARTRSKKQRQREKEGKWVDDLEKIEVRALCERHILSVCGAGIWNPGDLVRGRVSLVVFWPEVLWVALDVCRHLSWCRGEGHSGHYMVFFRIAFGAILTLDGRRKWQPTPVFLPGKSPWVEEPVGLWSMGSQRVRHKWRDLALLWVGGYSRQSCVDLQHQQPQRCCQKWRFGDPLTQTYKIRISRV